MIKKSLESTEANVSLCLLRYVLLKETSNVRMLVSDFLVSYHKCDTVALQVTSIKTHERCYEFISLYATFYILVKNTMRGKEQSRTVDKHTARH